MCVVVRQKITATELASLCLLALFLPLHLRKEQSLSQDLSGFGALVLCQQLLQLYFDMWGSAGERLCEASL